MLKGFLSLFLLMSLASCGKGGGGSNSGDGVSLDEISPNSAVPTAALNFDVKVNLENFNTTQEAKVLEAKEMIKTVVASEEFKNKILNFSHNGKKGFVDTTMTNAEVYKTILEGSEMLHQGVDNTMNLDLEVYTDQTIVVGYTLPSVIKIWMNSKYLNINNAAAVTTNMMHEWLHKLGFKHTAELTPVRQYSVPYAVGYIMRDLARRL